MIKKYLPEIGVAVCVFMLGLGLLYNINNLMVNEYTIVHSNPTECGRLTVYSTK